jgi:hypothetical protein
VDSSGAGLSASRYFCFSAVSILKVPPSQGSGCGLLVD